jgi:hypothetical protein
MSDSLEFGGQEHSLRRRLLYATIAGVAVASAAFFSFEKSTATDVGAPSEPAARAQPPNAAIHLYIGRRAELEFSQKGALVVRSYGDSSLRITDRTPAKVEFSEVECEDGWVQGDVYFFGHGVKATLYGETALPLGNLGLTCMIRQQLPPTKTGQTAVEGRWYTYSTSS